MNKIKNKIQKGFTLIEIIVALTIMGILVSVVSLPLSMGARAYVTARTLLQAHDFGRGVLWRMKRELRQMRKGNLSLADSNAITFTDAYALSIAYTVSGSQVFRNTELLGESINSIDFTYYDAANNVLSSVPLSAGDRALVYSINIDIEILHQGEIYNFKHKVFPRDLKY